MFGALQRLTNPSFCHMICKTTLFWILEGGRKEK